MRVTVSDGARRICILDTPFPAALSLILMKSQSAPPRLNCPQGSATSNLLLTAVALLFLVHGAAATVSNCVPAGTVSWWKAEGNALDSAGSNLGALNGGVTFGAGRVGRAFVFDGYQGTRVDLGDVPALR